MDVSLSLLLVASLALLGVVYGVRTVRAGAAHYARVDAEGESAIVAKGAMEMFYWSLQPLADACARAGITANMVTWSSLVLGAAAAVAFACDHLGLGAWLAVFSAGGDALDGLVARNAGTASEAGEVLDTTVDRYVELGFLFGLALRERASALAIALVLGAVAGSFMVSYSSAHAEAFGVTPPRGSMRRTERAVVLLFGVALTPLTPLVGVSERFRDAPLLVALALITVLGNGWAIVRLAHVASTLRKRDALARAEAGPHQDERVAL